MIGARALQPALDLRDPPVEIVDQLNARPHVTEPRLGEIQAGEQPPATGTEQVRHRDLMAERDQRRVHPVLEDRAVLDQVQPPPRALTLLAELGRRQPDRRHQIPERQLRQHARVDPVGLARQRRQPLDPLRVGDQHLPPVADQLVVHEPRTVHRLHHPAHRLVIHRHPPASARTARRDPPARGNARPAHPRSRSSTHRPACGSDPNPRATQPTTPFHKTSRISPAHHVT